MSDGYIAYARPGDDGVMIQAGCHLFTVKQATAHWTNTRKGTPLGDERFAMIKAVKEVAKIRGWSLTPVKKKEAA